MTTELVGPTPRLLSTAFANPFGMNYYSYVVARDYGFAPNPFGEYCTLATCKPKIRKAAQVGDWIIGTGSKQMKLGNRLIFAMQVSEALTFDEYWISDRFAYKKPVLNGSIVQMFGDNIYHHNGAGWLQENSHHSNEDGSANLKNLNRDTSADRVLAATHFFYFGKACPEIPAELLEEVCKAGIGEKKLTALAGQQLVEWLTANYEPGLIDDPLQFDGGKFDRYDGGK